MDAVGLTIIAGLRSPRCRQAPGDGTPRDGARVSYRNSNVAE